MSTLLHEIGHLSVARHFGAPANRMGVGLWWGLFPAFYADVTSAWLLSRKQRIAVTLAGPFFTLVSMIPIGVGSLALHGPVGDACFFALVMSGTSFVFNLLPFGRLDGYWVLVDLTGERFLLRNSSDAIRSFFRGGPLYRFSNVVLIYALGRLLLTVCILTVIAFALHSLVEKTQSIESFSTGVVQSLWGFLPISFAIFVLWSVATIFKSTSSKSA
jgi:putative peptide zinc metalloprotease protein